MIYDIFLYKNDKDAPLKYVYIDKDLAIEKYYGLKESVKIGLYYAIHLVEEIKPDTYKPIVSYSHAND